MGANPAFAALRARARPTPVPAALSAGGEPALSVRFGRLGDPSPELRGAWDELATAASEPNIFSERWFVTAAARNLPQGPEAHLIELWEERGSRSRLVGLMPLAISRRYGRMPVSHVTNWGHYQCFLGTPLIRAGRESDAWTAILAALDGMKWAQGFLHVDGLVEQGPVHRGLIEVARARGASCDTVHRTERALLESDLGPEQYYERTIRKKKRKELKRLANRLAELGTVTTRRLGAGDDAGPWCDAFLALERAGWKGSAGSALGSTPGTERFFREVVAGAQAAGRLEILRIDLDERPIAMLVNFIAPPGAFSFKIAFDEEFARFSPGVLIEIENLQVLARGDVAWMDSCAVENHPMINSLWGERRAIVRVTTPFRRPRSRMLFALCRSAERAAAAAKRSAAARRPAPVPEKEPCDAD